MRLMPVIVNWRTPDMTFEALQTLLPELEGIDARVLVIDNDSQDGSYETLSQRVKDHGWQERVEVVASGKNGGYGYGNNVGFRMGMHAPNPPEYFFVLNSDAFVDPGAIAPLLEFMDAHPRAGIAGTYVHGVDGEPHRTAFRFPTAAGELESQIRLRVVTEFLEDDVIAPVLPQRATRMDWVSGASMIVRRAMLEDIGLFDETFFLYYGETDLCMRAARNDWEVWYVPESSVAHVGSASTGLKDQARRTPTYWFDSRRYFYLKNMGRAALWKANAAWLVGSSLWKVRRILTRDERRDPPHQIRDFVRHALDRR